MSMQVCTACTSSLVWVWPTLSKVHWVVESQSEASGIRVNCNKISQRLTCIGIQRRIIHPTMRLLGVHLAYIIHYRCNKIQICEHIPSHFTPASFPGAQSWTPIPWLFIPPVVYWRPQANRVASYPLQETPSRWYGPELSPKWAFGYDVASFQIKEESSLHVNL